MLSDFVINVPEAIPCASIEIRDLETMAYYPADIRDYNSQSSTVLVHYQHTLKGEDWVNPNRIRKVEPLPTKFQPKEGDVVETYAMDVKDGAPAWWKVTVLTTKGNMSTVAYSEDLSDMVENTYIRPLNRNPPLGPEDFKRHTEKIHPSLIGFTKVTDYEVVRRSGILMFHFSGKDLVFFGSQEAIHRASSFAKLAFKHQSELKQMRTEADEKSKVIKEMQKKAQEGTLVQFKISKSLLGLVIGEKGKNISEAESIPGVEKIQVDNRTYTVSIVAKTPQAALKARERLEFVEDRYSIPRSQIGIIVGPNFESIKDIQKQSGVLRIRLVRDPENPRKEFDGKGRGGKVRNKQSNRPPVIEEQEKEESSSEGKGKAKGTKDQRRRKAKEEKEKEKSDKGKKDKDKDKEKEKVEEAK